MYVNNNKSVSGAYRNTAAELQKSAENVKQTEQQNATKTDKLDFSYQYEKAKNDLISSVEHKVVNDAKRDELSDGTRSVESFKTQIQSGNYVIDPTAIATSMLSTEE